MGRLHFVWTQLWITVVVLLVSLAIYTSLGRQLIPLVETYRDDLIQQIELVTGQPTQVNRLIGGWDLLSPVVSIENIQIGEGEEAIQLEQIRARLDIASSLFFRQLVFSSILIRDVTVSAERVDNDQLRLADDWILPLNLNDSVEPDDDASLQAVITWLGLQHEIRLQNWSINYRDSHRQQQEFFRVDDISLRSQGQQHLINASGFWGDKDPSKIAINAELQGDLWPWKDQSGDIYLSLGKRQWQSLIPSKLPKNIQISDALMAAEGWLTLENGDLHRLFLTLTADSFQLLSNGESLQLNEGQIKLEGGHLGDDWHIRVTPDFATVLPVDFVEVSSVNLGERKGWFVELPEYQMQDLLSFIMRYDWFPAQLTSYLKQIEPTGQVDSSHLMFIPNRDRALAIELQVTDMDSQAYRGIPGVKGASGQLQLQPGIGAAILSEQDIEINFPKLYQQPRRLQSVTGRYLWDVRSGMLRMQLQDMKAILDGTEVSGEVAVRLPKAGSLQEPHVGMQIGFQQGPLSLQRVFMPDRIAPDVSDWLNNSLIDGRLSNVGFILNGNPNVANGLSTLLAADVSNGHLNYAEGWPEVTDIDGRFTMNIPKVDVRLSRGQTLGGQLNDGAMVSIRPYGDDAEVQVTGTVRGDSAEALAYFQQTPLIDLIDNAVADWSAKGSHQTQLNIRIPLLSKESQQRLGESALLPQINLVTDLRNSQLKLQELDIEINNIAGQLNFSNQRGLQSDGIRGRLFNDELQATIDSVVDNEIIDIRLAGRGKAQWSALKDWLDLFLLEPVSGSLAYQGELLVRNQQRGGIHLDVVSDGLGTLIDLPEPLKKTASAVTPINLSVTSADLTDIRFKLDDELAGVLRFQDSLLERGQISLGNIAPVLPQQSGVEVTGRVPQRVNLDQWWDVWDDFLRLSKAADQRLVQAGGEPAQNPVQRFDVELAQLDVYQTIVDDTSVSGRFSDGLWNVQFANQITQGLAAIPLADLPITLNLDYVHWLNSTDIAAASTLTEQEYLTNDPLLDVMPAEISAMNISIQELYVDSFNYGRWQIHSRPTATGLIADIIDSDLQGMTVNGRLRWDLQNQRHRTELSQWQLRSTDIGAVQQAFRLDPFIQAKQFSVNTSLDWLGSPLAIDLDYPRALSGSINLQAKDGNVNADGAEALKIFGILNASTIARRLRLDFSDLVRPGFNFDSLRAEANVEQGRLELTEPVKVEGTSGKFLASGSADLTQDELDMKLAVTFPVTGTLPMVAVIAGVAPPLAGAIYVTEKLIGEELERFTSASYRLQGSLSQPQLSIEQAFDNDVDGRQRSGFFDRILSIFGIGDD